MILDGGHSPVGRVVAIERSLRAFVPHPAPRSLNLDNRLVKLVTEASQRAATLGGIGEMLPDPDLLMYPFLSREAVLSSRIEGTQTLMTDLFLYEGSDTRQDPHGDAGEACFGIEQKLPRGHDLLAVAVVDRQSDGFSSTSTLRPTGSLLRESLERSNSPRS